MTANKRMKEIEKLVKAAILANDAASQNPAEVQPPPPVVAPPKKESLLRRIFG